MKPLKNFLNPKSQWHKSKEFPEKQNEYDIIDFLENKGFECSDKCETITDFKEALEKSDCPLYNIANHDIGRWIRFANNGRLDETNPIFACGLTNEPPKVLVVRWGLEPHKCKTYKNYDDFRNEVNSFFNWK